MGQLVRRYALEAIDAEFPSATFVLNHRRVIEDWISSVDHWSELRARRGVHVDSP
jgi:hypothetical protein